MCWRRRIGIALLGLALVSSAQASVVNYWRFEDGSGSLVADSTGLADGILDRYFPTTAGAGDSGELGWSTNTAFSIVPQTQAANLGSLHFAPGPGVTLSPTAPMNYGSNFTVEFFFNLDTLPVVRSPYIFLAFSDADSGLRLQIGQLPTSGIRLQALGAIPLNADGVPLLANTWYHLAFVNTSTSSKLFLDGSLLASGSSIGGDFNFDTSGHYFIGTDNFSGGFDGYLDEIRISNVALEPSQFLNVPEPSTFALVGGALVSFAALRKRRAQCARPTP